MSDYVTLSTNIDPVLKEALVTFCKNNGLKIQHFIEKAIIEQLECADDLNEYFLRKDEETIPLKKLVNE